MTNNRPDRVWTLDCGHEIICDELHYVGQSVYCSKCNKHLPIREWRTYVRNDEAAGGD